MTSTPSLPLDALRMIFDELMAEHDARAVDYLTVSNASPRGFSRRSPSAYRLTRFSLVKHLTIHISTLQRNDETTELIGVDRLRSDQLLRKRVAYIASSCTDLQSVWCFGLNHDLHPVQWDAKQVSLSPNAYELPWIGSSTVTAMVWHCDYTELPRQSRRINIYHALPEFKFPPTLEYLVVDLLNMSSYTRAGYEISFAELVARPSFKRLIFVTNNMHLLSQMRSYPSRAWLYDMPPNKVYQLLGRLNESYTAPSRWLPLWLLHVRGDSDLFIGDAVVPLI
ncbi:hypothetical protein EXIGLDRAFT_839251 [Exidia glandulosa HHB12029]|uniref:Uncharacterized protein n=1 Tax=Exidia glandulosa HHB12029 TaxID=1314781 RepID=A0A165F4L5_EXIGL|nr:hypothetical protein EXIGLDRAFT_839251 [Exidia glandulosa HHB12029]